MKPLGSPIVRSSKFTWADVVLGLAIFAVLYAVIQLALGMDVRFSVQDQPKIELSWRMLPYYAGRSLLRMFIAFFFSLLFTFIYGRIAAQHRIAEKIMIPIIDILQSVPVLGFLSVTVTGFMALFPNRLLGVECASIFAIFTGQVWNMTFSFYQSVSALPRELREAAAIQRLDSFARFTRLELPYSMIGLVWNSMMSFGGAWFFLAASESITVLNHNIQLPGIGSYMATAMKEGNVPAIIASIVTMIIMIVLVDQLFWRPVVAWSQKFKMELSESDVAATSWFLNVLKRSPISGWVARPFRWLFRVVDDSISHRLARRNKFKTVKKSNIRRILSIVVAIFLLGVLLYYGYRGINEVTKLHIGHVLYICLLGFYTLLRVLASTLIALLWTIPVGVWIGLNPRVSRIVQPIVQIAASFPANMFFPLITLLYLQLHVNFQYGAIPLMMLGTQWYILFNVIAGAMSIPSDLKEAVSVLGLTRRDRWRTLYLPVIFPYLITGCITASGGAWNASIIAEIISWKGKTLAATGLGTFITQVTTEGRWTDIVLGIVVMSVFVTVINRLLWRPLYRYSERFHVS